MFLSPEEIAVAPIITVFIPEAQTLLTVVVGVSKRIPDPRVTCLAGAYPLPAELTLPR
jgi:hypothetical protein